SRARTCHSTKPRLELRNACPRPMLEPMTRDSLDAPPGTHLIVETEPRPEDIRFLEEHLHEFNIQATGISDAKLLSLFVRATDGSLVGGLLAGRGEEPATSAIFLFRPTCASKAWALCSCAR